MAPAAVVRGIFRGRRSNIVPALVCAASLARAAIADGASPPRLAGTIMSREASVAVLVDKQQGTRTVGKGGEFLGWRVEAVEREQVILSRGGRTFRVPLEGDPEAVAITSMIPPPGPAADADPVPPEDLDPARAANNPNPRRAPHGLR